jgi:hypothetical protein
MKTLLLPLFSAGWLLPLYFSVSWYLDWLRLEVEPRFHGQSPMNSFPFLHFSGQAFGISACWLALVIVVWTFLVLEHFQKTSRKDAEPGTRP